MGPLGLLKPLGELVKEDRADEEVRIAGLAVWAVLGRTQTNLHEIASVELVATLLEVCACLRCAGEFRAQQTLLSCPHLPRRAARPNCRQARDRRDRMLGSRSQVHRCNAAQKAAGGRLSHVPQQKDPHCRLHGGKGTFSAERAAI